MPELTLGNGNQRNALRVVRNHGGSLAGEKLCQLLEVLRRDAIGEVHLKIHMHDHTNIHPFDQSLSKYLEVDHQVSTLVGMLVVRHSLTVDHSLIVMLDDLTCNNKAILTRIPE